MVKAFGIEDMAALAGGSQTEEMAAFRPSMAGPQLTARKKNLPNKEPDLSTMSAAETAALLMEKNTGKGSSSPHARYRTNRKLEHHEFAQELSKEMQFRQRRDQQFRQQDHYQKDTKFSDSEAQSADEFVARKGTTRRQRAAPQIISRSEVAASDIPSAHQRKLRTKGDDDDSNSDSSEDNSRRKKRPRRPLGRRRRGSEDDYSSTSSNSDEDDRRRERLRGRRKRDAPQIVRTVATAPPSEKEIKMDESKSETVSMPPTRLPVDPLAAMPKEAPRKRKSMGKQSASSSGGSSNTSSSSDGTSSSSEGDDTSSEEEEAIAKPVFVPKNKRNLLKSAEMKFEEQALKAERERRRSKTRKMESRAIVAKTVVGAQSANVEETAEEGGGATNAPPNDDDTLDREMEHDAWEVRELRRLFEAMDGLKRREKEKLEHERRRQMTDDEVLQQDIKAGRYQAPGSHRDGQPSGKFMQRFYHRGVFYMAEDEWDRDDVRRKAADYARAATGQDKIDKSALPEVMQVKGFGFARQNTRYKGLAKEDTTDKKQSFLPLIHGKKK